MKQNEEKIDEIPVNKLAIESAQKEILNNINFFNDDNKDSTQNSFDYDFSIGLMGDMEVGKTSITHYFYKGTPLKYSQATVRFEYHYKLMKFKEKNIKIKLWDTTGKEIYRGLVMGLLRGVHAVMIVFSLAVYYDKVFGKDKEEEWKNSDEKKGKKLLKKLRLKLLMGLNHCIDNFLYLIMKKIKLFI